MSVVRTSVHAAKLILNGALSSVTSHNLTWVMSIHTYSFYCADGYFFSMALTAKEEEEEEEATVFITVNKNVSYDGCTMVTITIIYSIIIRYQQYTTLPVTVPRHVLTPRCKAHDFAKNNSHTLSSHDRSSPDVERTNDFLPASGDICDITEFDSQCCEAICS